MSRAKKIVIAVVAAGALAIGGVFAWILFIRDDAPPALTSSDLDDALDGTVATGAPADSASASDSDSTSTEATGNTAVDTAIEAVTDPSGTWTISTDSVLGYRVSEVLGGVDAEGAGRTSDVTGSLVIDGSTATSAEFTVQMASITSDSDRRDGQFNGRIMSTDEFPTATFVLTEPIDFGSVPSEGATITTTATGDLTLRGVTNSVTFDVEAKLEGGRIGVLGNIAILFSEYDIPDPSNGFAVVKDNGLLEFVLVFDKAA
jgi:polyisoprenoid-binding protein YceI